MIMVLGLVLSALPAPTEDDGGPVATVEGLGGETVSTSTRADASFIVNLSFTDCLQPSGCTYEYAPTSTSGNSVSLDAEVELNVLDPGDATSIEVELLATTPSGWTCTVSPSTVSMDPEDGATTTVSVTVNIPDDHSAGLEVVTISGTASALPGGVDGGVNSNTITIDVQAFYDFSVRAIGGARSSGVEERTTFEFQVDNLGNSKDNYEVEVVNQGELWDDDIDVAVTTGIQVNAGQNTIEKITVIPHKDTPSGDYDIEIKVTSFGGGQEDTFTITIKVTNDRTTGYIVYALLVIIIIVVLILVIRARKKRREGYGDVTPDDEVEFEMVDSRHVRGHRRSGPRGGRGRPR